MFGHLTIYSWYFTIATTIIWTSSRTIVWSPHSTWCVGAVFLSLLLLHILLSAGAGEEGAVVVLVPSFSPSLSSDFCLVWVQVMRGPLLCWCRPFLPPSPPLSAWCGCRWWGGRCCAGAVLLSLPLLRFLLSAGAGDEEAVVVLVPSFSLLHFLLSAGAGDEGAVVVLVPSFSPSLSSAFCLVWVQVMRRPLLCWCRPSLPPSPPISA
jgi:hypothetical protein